MTGANEKLFVDTPKPVIAVLNGTASGGGAMLALLADACVAADTVQLSLPEIDLGIATFSGANILETNG
jgi:enoyl-CoA hydratase/carnithine racemase